MYNSGDDNEFGFGLESSELRICSGSSAFIGFRTGGYAGTERMRLDSSGRLLIGTTTPGDSSADDLTLSTSGHTGLSIKSGSSHAGGIYFGDGTSGASQYEGIIQYSHSLNAFQFYTNYSGSSATRMTIDSSGRVLMGTTTEGHATADNLTIADSGHCGITLRSGNDSVGTIFFSDGTSGDAEYEGYVQYDHTGNFMKFATNHAETLRIDSSGLITQGGKTASNHGSPNLLLWGADPTLHLSATGSTANTSFAGIKFAVAGGSTGDYSKAGIFVQRQDSFNDLDMIFAFRATNDSAGVAISDEKLRIDSDGRLLIGTTSDFVRGQIQVIDGGGGEITIGRDDTTVVSGEDLGHLFFASNDETGTGVIAATISAFSDANHTSASAPTNLRFATCATNATSSAERMRINNLGRVGVFAAANSDVMQLSATAGSGESYEYLRGMHGATAMYDGTLSFRVFTNGDVENTNGDYGNISDIKLKENIVDATSQWNDLKAVRFRKFNFKAETGNQTHTQLGVIAQELELTSPGLVRETVDRDKDGNDLGTTTKSVKSSVLTMKALVALQEAMARIETLESEVAALKG